MPPNTSRQHSNWFGLSICGKVDQSAGAAALPLPAHLDVRALRGKMNALWPASGSSLHGDKLCNRRRNLGSGTGLNIGRLGLDSQRGIVRVSRPEFKGVTTSATAVLAMKSPCHAQVEHASNNRAVVYDECPRYHVP
jgi:hypothetical protein